MNSTTKVTVWQAAGEDGFLKNLKGAFTDTYTSLDEMEEVYAFIVSEELTDEQLLNQVFSDGNDEDSDLWDNLNYAISVGDIVQIENTFYRCLPVGWVKENVDTAEEADDDAETVYTEGNCSQTMDFSDIWDEVEEEFFSEDTSDQTCDEQVESAGRIADKIVQKFHSFVDGLDTVLGFRGLKLSISNIWSTGKTGDAHSLKLMAEESKRIISAKIKELSSYGDEVSLRKALKLKRYTTASNGKSIFDAVVVLMLYICKRLSAKVQKWTGVDIKNKLVSALVSGLKAGMKALNAAVKCVGGVLKNILAYSTAAVLKVVDFITRAFKAVVEKINNWREVRNQKIS